MKKTKIVCTIGPKSESKEMLVRMVSEGMNVMRLNFSHGNHAEHGERIKTMRDVVEETGERVAVLLDTKGPEIRTISLEGGQEIILEEGQEFTLTTDKNIVGNKSIVAVTYEGLPSELKEGDTVLVDDGLIKLVVKSVFGKNIMCTVNNSGNLGENKGINLPGISVKLPALSLKDIEDLKFGCREDIDFVAASFIRKADDVREVRKILDENGGGDIKIISKIENQEGVDNFDEILELSDGIMVARGDLGVEIPVEEVPFAQKKMIEKCNEAGKMVITATQMLESMVKNPRPTRAEAGDVANAIIDGTDAVMLSGETAKGDYPVESVAIMSKIAEKTDSMIPANHTGLEREITVTEAVAKGTVDASEVLNANLIAVGTQSGRAAQALRRYFPTAHILALTNNRKTANQLTLLRGVVSVVEKGIVSLDEFHKRAEVRALEMGLVKTGDIIVATCGEKVFKTGTTNSFKVIIVK